jgi:exosome complex component RRP46
MVSVGETKAIASVSGPIEVRLAAEQASKATFEVIIRPLSNVPGTESKALAATIRSLLTPSLLLPLNPRTLVQLVIQSLSPSPSVKFHPSLIAYFINFSIL